MSLQQKSYSFKSNDDTLPEGKVHAVVSCFGNKDSDDDVVVKGFFARSITEGKNAGKLPPGIFHHDWKQPVALTEDAWEDHDGLHVLGQFNLKTQRGSDTYYDIKAGILTEYSFGFMNVKSERKEGVRYMQDGDWLEWSPVLIGANRKTHTVTVKGAAMPDIERDMCYAALEAVQDEIWWQVYKSCFYQRDTPLSDKVSSLDAMMSEAHMLTVQTFEHFMSMTDTAKESGAGSSEYDWFKSRTLAGKYPVAAKGVVWEENTAKERIKAWAGGDKPNSAYGSAFLYADKKSLADYSAYQLPIVDIIGGTPYIIPAAVKAAVNGVDSLPEEAKESVQASLGRWSVRLKSVLDEPLRLPWEGLTLEKHAASVLALTDGLVKRAEEVSALREEDKKDLSTERKAAFKELANRLIIVAEKDVSSMVEFAEYAKFQAINARLLGVPV